MRIPRPLRPPLLFLVLLLSFFLLGERVEGLRLRIFALMVQPARLFDRDHAEERPIMPEALINRRLAAERRRAGEAFGVQQAAQVVVFDLDLPQERFLVGAGRLKGIKRGDLVRSREGVVGVIDRVEDHVARVRFLTARGLRLAVAVAPPEGGPDIVAALRGEGGRAVLVQASLTTAVSEGAVVKVLSAGPDRAVEIGTVAKAGLVAEVRLRAAPGALREVVVLGLEIAPRLDELFRVLPATVERRPNAVQREGLLRLASSDEVAVGAAVLAEHRYLGRVAGASGRLLRVLLPEHPEHGGQFALLLADEILRRCEAPSLASAVAAEGLAPNSEAVGVLATLGGEQLTPPGAFVGVIAETDSPRYWPAVRRWPQLVQVVAFRFNAERSRLLAR